MGHIVADFIDTGILTADIIKTGILESKNGKSWLDMSTGDFNFGDKVKYENGKFEIIVESSDGGNTSLGDELSNMNNKIDSITHAPTVELTGEQAFLYENNFTGTPTPPSIKISARVENVENPTYEWYFKRSGETSWTPIANNNYNYYNVFHNDSTIFNNSSVKNVTFKCSVGDVYDEFTIVKVSSGSNGTIGNDGIGITEIQEQYYLSDSQQTLIGGTWQTTAPTWVKGKYIWTRTQFTYSNGNVTTTSPICVTGKDGADGLNGGVSVENVDMFYYQSTSATSLQGGSWTTTAPTWVNGKYVWSKTITYLDNGTQIESNPVCITGERGQNGIDGINGTNGKDGISTYFFIRYSEFSDGSSMTSTPNAKTKYMGTATTTNNVAPTTPSSYTWTLVKGADGKDGEQGIAGANGSSSYLHIKYSNDGRTFTANNGEELGTWIGTYVNTNPTDSSVFSDYNWVRFVGEDGADAYTVLLSNENHTFPSTYEGNIENAITITTVAIAYKGKTSITPTIGTLPTVTGLSLSKSGNAVTIVANKGTSLADTGTFKIPVIVDGITFEKTFSWSKSKNGLSGTDGEDGYTVFLTNENFTFVADDTGNITKAQTTTTNILAYKGSNSLAFTIGTLPTVNGLTLSKTTDTITIKANTGTSLADVGSFDIIINADGKSFTKKFSWSKTKTGASGSNAEYVTVTGEQVFKYTNNFSGTPTPSSIKLTATKFNTTATGKWQYKNASGTWTDCTSNDNPVTALTLNISPTSYLLSSEKQMSVRYIVGSLYDEISIVKVSDGAKGDTGATGSSGIGINSITEYYAVSSSNTTAPTSWSTTVPTMTATNKYLWNYETITYSNNTTTNTSKRVIGVYGDKGNTGSTGATGNGISKITNYYLATSSSSGVTTSTSGWTTSVQVVSASKKYLWNYEVVTYTNASTSTTTPCIIGTYGDKGDKGDKGNTGNGINTITEYYAISSSNTTAPTSWSTTVPNMTSTNKYLWNYEVIKYTDNTTKETEKRVIGAYGDKGATGSTGATGNGISKITNYYLASSSSSGVTTSTSGWTTSVQSVSSNKKYLWNYEVITYTNGSTTTTTPCIIGAYGDTGATGNAGADAYTVILTNESHTFATQNNGNISSAISTTTQVLAYKGAKSITPTIGTLPTVNGLTLSKSGTTITIQANTGTSLADSGSFNIPVTVDGKSFTKTFSWSKSKQGATGATGATGASGTNAKSVDIVASTQVFKSTDGGKTFLPNSIVLTAVLQNVTYNGWQCSTDGGKTWSGLSNSTTGWSVSNGVLTINNNFGLFTSTNTTVVFRVNTNDSKIYDTITLVKLYDVTDIDVGGRNYLVNSNFINGLDKWTIHDVSNNTGTSKGVTTDIGGSWCDPNVNSLVIRGTSVVGRYGVQSSDMRLTANTKYTISGYCAGHRVGKIQVNVRDRQSSDANIHTVNYTPVSGGNSLSKYYRFETTFTTTSNTLFALNLYSVDLADNGYVWFANVKLEKGNKASDWSPSPEDIDNDINNAVNPLIKTDEQLTQRLDNAFSDDVITAYEKIQIASDLKEIDAQYDDMTKTVKSYNDSSITGIYNEYKVAYNNLHTALDPCLKNMDIDTKLSNSVVKDAFLLYGTYYSHLRSAIDDYIKNSFDTTKSSITSLSKSVDIAITKSSTNEQNLNIISKHMKFSDEGWLELFATTNGEKGRFKTTITDTKLSFTDNNQEVAYMSNQKLYINYAQINNDLQIGSIVVTKSDKGGIVFKWQ